jgi:hypothetical protein
VTAEWSHLERVLVGCPSRFVSRDRKSPTVLPSCSCRHGGEVGREDGYHPVPSFYSLLTLLDTEDEGDVIVINGEVLREMSSPATISAIEEHV